MQIKPSKGIRLLKFSSDTQKLFDRNFSIVLDLQEKITCEKKN